MEQHFENFILIFFPKKRKISQEFLTSCDFRPPELRSDYRLSEIHCQNRVSP